MLKYVDSTCNVDLVSIILLSVKSNPISSPSKCGQESLPIIYVFTVCGGCCLIIFLVKYDLNTRE